MVRGESIAAITLLTATLLTTTAAFAQAPGERIAPPQASNSRRALFGEQQVACPQCGSENTELLSEFGSTACKALWRCRSCREPFDYFKCH